MASQLHEIDPDGDVILTLRNPNAPFAVWPQTRYELVLRSPSPRVEKSLLSRSWTTPFGSGIAPRQEPGGTTDNETAVAEPVSTALVNVEPGIPSPDGDRPEPAADTAPAGDQAAAALQPLVDPGRAPEIRMRLSSKHLVLASPYFRKMLRGEWQEATPQPGHEHHIEAEDWDVEALLLLMRVIHGRNLAVPEYIGLEMLAKVAVLVDYYKCYESVDILRRFWIAALRPSMPSTYGRDLVLWLFIAWVFTEDDVFRIATKNICNTMTDTFATLGLPIPQTIVEAINRKRRDLMLNILRELKTILGELRGRQRGCSFECSSALLGALTIQLHENRLLEADLESSLPGHSAESVLKAVSNMQSPVRPPAWSPGAGFSVALHDNKSCDLSFMMQPSLTFARELTAANLSLGDFLGEGDKPFPERQVEARTSVALELSFRELAVGASRTDVQNIPTTFAARGYRDFTSEWDMSGIDRFFHLCAEAEFMGFSPEEVRLADCYAMSSVR